MADPALGLGNPFINPTGWMNHPVDWEQRRRELRAEADAERDMNRLKWLMMPKSEYKRRNRFRAAEEFWEK